VQVAQLGYLVEHAGQVLVAKLITNPGLQILHFDYELHVKQFSTFFKHSLVLAKSLTADEENIHRFPCKKNLSY
jgi:hypothetical protein